MVILSSVKQPARTAPGIGGGSLAAGSQILIACPLTSKIRNGGAHRLKKTSKLDCVDDAARRFGEFIDEPSALDGPLTVTGIAMIRPSQHAG